MLAYLVAIVVAIAVIPLTRGSVTRLAELRFQRVWLLALGLAIQIALDVVDIPRARYEDLGVGLLLVSYVAVLGFCASNARIRGIELVGIGIGLNALVIALNLGMPYRVGDGAAPETTVKHRPTRDSDIALVLSDRFVVGGPFDAAISVGDIVLALGIVQVAYSGSRVRRTTTRRRDRPRYVDLAVEESSREIDLRDQPTGTASASTTRSKASNTRRS